jgi:hypothetical protein
MPFRASGPVHLPKQGTEELKIPPFPQAGWTIGCKRHTTYRSSASLGSIGFPRHPMAWPKQDGQPSIPTSYQKLETLIKG